jgi:hypothetical protein
VNTPYTETPLDALMTAQASLGAVLSAVIWFRPLAGAGWGARAGTLPSRAATALFLSATWIAVFYPVLPFVARAFMLHDPLPTAPLAWLRASALLATLALLAARVRWLALVVCVIGEVGLWWLCSFLQQSELELAAAHLVWLGALLGIVELFTPRATDAPRSDSSTPPRESFFTHDLRVFALAVLVSALVALFVLDRRCNSGDEWGNTYNADLFAHFQAYGTPPPCPRMFKNWWVFFHLGRAFSQYTPGWSLFMAPFQRIGLVWMSGPIALGLTTVAVARLSRRAAAGLGATPEESARVIRAAGTIGALTSIAGSTMLLNAASRFPHTMVSACFAWAIECTAIVCTPNLSRRAQWAWGAALGVVSAWLVSTRPSDGLLGVGVAIYFVQALVRRRVGWRAVVAAFLGSTLWGGLSLVILRLQLGTWLTTGYSLAPMYTGHQFSMSWPKPNEFKYGFPIATGSYMWWPCAPALGVAGLFAVLRRPGRGIAFMLAIGGIGLAAFYNMVEFGRYFDSGYGPRYHLPLVVAMAVGGAIVLARVWVRASSGDATTRALRDAGPWVLAVAALVAGVLRAAPLVYPLAHREIRERTAPLRVIDEAKLKNAIVTVQDGEIGWVAWDLAQNLPTEKNPDVLILVNQGEPELSCAHKAFPGRTWFRAVGKTEDVELQPR